MFPITTCSFPNFCYELLCLLCSLSYLFIFSHLHLSFHTCFYPTPLNTHLNISVIPGNIWTVFIHFSPRAGSLNCIKALLLTSLLPCSPSGTLVGHMLKIGDNVCFLLVLKLCLLNYRLLLTSCLMCMCMLLYFRCLWALGSKQCIVCLMLYKNPIKIV